MNSKTDIALITGSSDHVGTAVMKIKATSAAASRRLLMTIAQPAHRQALLVSRGVNPQAPSFEENDMTVAQLFWVAKNGIRFTGMPAWGPSRSDQNLWDAVGFVMTFPKNERTRLRRTGSSHALRQSMKEQARIPGRAPLKSQPHRPQPHSEVEVAMKIANNSSTGANVAARFCALPCNFCASCSTSNAIQASRVTQCGLQWGPCIDVLQARPAIAEPALAPGPPHRGLITKSRSQTMKYSKIALSAVGASLALFASAPVFAAGPATGSAKGEQSTPHQGMGRDVPKGSDATRAEVKQELKAAKAAGKALPAGENITSLPGAKQAPGGKASKKTRAEVKKEAIRAKKSGGAVQAGEGLSTAQQKGQKQ